jgi:hypothetical protein
MKFSEKDISSILQNHSQYFDKESGVFTLKNENQLFTINTNYEINIEGFSKEEEKELNEIMNDKDNYLVVRLSTIIKRFFPLKLNIQQSLTKYSTKNIENCSKSIFSCLKNSKNQ